MSRAPVVRRSEILGAWSYHAWRITYEDGRITEPFGADASGLLLYTHDGFMSACIMAGERKPFARPNPREATLRERADAFDGYFSYAGRWRLVRGVVEHVGEGAWPTLGDFIREVEAWRDDHHNELVAVHSQSDFTDIVGLRSP